MQHRLIGLGKCETCKFLRYEADGGDGHPAIYCGKRHWSDASPPEPGEPYNDHWDNCPDYLHDNPLN